MKTNMGFMDRFIRLLAVVTFVSLYFSGYIPEGTVAMVFWVIGIIFLVTSLIGFCPLYALLGIGTAKKRTDV